MSIVEKLHLQCDGEGCEATLHGPDNHNALESLAATMGWGLTESTQLCPACRLKALDALLSEYSVNPWSSKSERLVLLVWGLVPVFDVRTAHARELLRRVSMPDAFPCEARWARWASARLLGRIVDIAQGRPVQLDDLGAPFDENLDGETADDRDAKAPPATTRKIATGWPF